MALYIVVHKTSDPILLYKTVYFYARGSMNIFHYEF